MPFSTFSSQHRPLSRIFSTAATAIVSSGLICHLKTAPPTGSTWTDDVGNSNATLANSPTYSSSDGGYISLNGSNQYIMTSTSLNAQIVFKDVSFQYADTKVLEDINLTVNAGKMIALVGQSGAGKSTMADLLPRFYDVTDGQILIDDIDIRKIKLHDLNQLMGIVTQESILFNDTIFNNIAFGNKSASREAVIAAAKIANADEFIIKLSDGYDTNIGDRGGKLSGGQRQRLSIARAVLKNPPILILDEATSALDTESEKLVQDAIHKLMQNRTSIVIAHRLSTIQHADTIVVMQDGKIIEQGKHAELISMNGTYKKLTDMQSFQ